jgi:hypothetical protein
MTYGTRVTRRLLLAATIVAPSLLGACSSQLPCLQYQPQTFTRTVSMRGHGMMQVTQEALVCTRRADLDDENLLGP